MCCKHMPHKYVIILNWAFTTSTWKLKLQPDMHAVLTFYALNSHPNSSLLGRLHVACISFSFLKHVFNKKGIVGAIRRSALDHQSRPQIRTSSTSLTHMVVMAYFSKWYLLQEPHFHKKLPYPVISKQGFKLTNTCSPHLCFLTSGYENARLPQLQPLLWFTRSAAACHCERIRSRALLHN